MNNETLAVTYSSAGDTAAASVGTYAITAQLSSGTGNPANYQVTVNSGMLTVNQAPLTLAVGKASQTYGQAVNLAAALGSTVATGANGESLAVTYMSTGDLATASVGSYSITAQLSGSTGQLSNYSVTVDPGTLTVTPASLTITAVSQTTTYGLSLPTLSASYSGFVNGETAGSLTTQPALTTTATASSPVGSYIITASGAADANYKITYVGGTLSVLQAPLAITAVSETMVYGSSVPALTASYSGFVNGDTSANLTTQPTLTTTVTSSSPVGSYPITVSGAADGNYAITYVRRHDHGDAGAVDHRRESAGAAAGLRLNAASGDLELHRPGQRRHEDLVPAQADLLTTATTPAGTTYTITPVGASDSNYKITYVDATGTIDQATPLVSVTDAGGVYDGKTFAVGAATVTGMVTDPVTGMVNAVTLASLTTDTGTLSITYSVVGANNTLTPLIGLPVAAGSYEAVASYTSDNSNYTNASGSVSFTISPASLIISAVSDTKYYDGSTASAKTPTFQVTSYNSALGESELAPNKLYNSDAFTTLTQSFDSANAGSRTLTASAVIGFELYDRRHAGDGNGNHQRGDGDRGGGERHEVLRRHHPLGRDADLPGHQLQQCPCRKRTGSEQAVQQRCLHDADREFRFGQSG